MSISISYLTKHLGPDAQASLAVNLAENLHGNSENVHALYDLLDAIDLTKYRDVYANIRSYFSNIIYDTEWTDYESAAKYLDRVPELRHDILNQIIATLQSYIHSNANWFIPEAKHILSGYSAQLTGPVETQPTEDLHSESSDSLLSLLNVLECLLMHLSDLENSALDASLLMLLAINEEKIAAKVSKLLRWRISFIVSYTTASSQQVVWDLIFSLYHTDVKFHRSHAFIFWLKYLNDAGFTPTSYFHQCIQENQYWEILQNGLTSSSHEHRKFCLSILKLSVQQIDVPLNNEYISWDPSKRDQQLLQWSRYVTLFEILGIDTSLHQAEAGSKDIVSLIAPDSLIHPSWGFCLLSTGFKASMDSVRKFSLKLLLSIPPQNLYLLKNGLQFLEHIYLPYAMIASHYAVRAVDGVNECEFGTKITAFIASIVSNLNTEEEYSQVVGAILKALVNLNDSYDPARIYVTQGIVQGLGDRSVLSFGTHEHLLYKLFENTSEGELYETCCQTLNLKLLVHFKHDHVRFLESLNRFVRFNGYPLLVKNWKLIQDFFRNTSSDTLFGLLVQVSEDCRVLVLALLDQPLADYLLTQPVSFLVKILESGFKVEALSNPRVVEKYQQVFTSEDEETYQSLSRADFTNYSQLVPPMSQLAFLWTSIIESLGSTDYHTLEVASQKLRLFNNLSRYHQKSVFSSFEPLVSLRSTLLVNTGNLSKTVKDFYKLKDEIFGQYYVMLEIASCRGLFENYNLASVVGLMNASSSQYDGNYAMVKTISNYLSNYPVSVEDTEVIVDFLTEMWLNLDSSRLQLNQKDLHILIINSMFDAKVLAVASEKLSHNLTTVSRSIISNSQGRRSLLPALTRKLSMFQIAYPEAFESSSWIVEIIIRASIMFQLRSNGFKIEAVIGKLYDRKISIAESNLYESIYGPDEICYKVYLVAMVNSVKSKAFAHKILDYIIDNEREFYFLTVNKSTDGLEEWTRIQLLSIIVSLVDKLDLDDSKLDTLLGLLETDPSPLARVYVEWIISFNLVSNSKYTNKIFNSLMNDLHSLKPSVVAAYQRMLFLMIQQQTDRAKETELLSKFMTIIVPGATSNKAVTRHFALSLSVSIFQEMELKKLELEPNLATMLNNMYKSAIKSDSYGQYRSGDALLWDINADLTLVGVSGGVFLRLSDRDDIDFIPRETFVKYLSQGQIQALNHPIGDNCKDLWIKERKAPSKTTETVELFTQSPLQTKSGAWNTIMDVDMTARGHDITRSDLIVVSSLVDKPPNLGGICRLSDVLGAGLLTLNDIKVKNHPQFKNVAVTADQWMPMVEVKVDQIKEYLIEKKKEGYTLIGLEQTDKSVELNNELKFPKKSLILLGREKEGVPGDLLAELDMCVEIKQVGVIRSMNIQTATAIIVHAYSTQHC